MAGIKICPNCGKINKEEVKFCGECGNSLTESTEIKKPKQENVGYLVCNDCGGLYKLNKGESPDDFESCQCGGKLIHTQDPANLKDLKSKGGKPDKKTAINSDITRNILGIIDKKAIVVGGLVSIACIILLYQDIYYSTYLGDVGVILTPITILSGLIIGFLVYKKDYYVAVFNGAIIGLIPFFYMFIVHTGYIAWSGPSSNVSDVIFSSIRDFIYYLLVGAISAVIGGFITLKFRGK